MASRYDEDEEDDEGDELDADPDGTIEEEDEDAAEQEEQELKHVHEQTPVTRPQHSSGEVCSSYSQNRNRAQRYRRSFGGRW